MTKLEELKAAMDAAEDAYDAAYANTLAASDAAKIACDAAYAAATRAAEVSDASYLAYQKELEKQNDKT